MNQANALLPESTIDFFVIKEETKQLCDSLETDWRFARVQINVMTGTIENAIQHYQDQRSSDIVIIETERIDENFTNQLESLASACIAGTGAIFIGPTNDVKLYRQLIDMGVTDYLVNPVEKDDLVTTISKGLSQKIGTSDSQMISVMGAKGGVGTSTVAQILAWNLTQSIGQKSVLMDCAGGWGIAPLTYQIEPVITLREAGEVALKNKKEAMDDLLHHVDENLSYLAVGGDPMLSTTINGDGFENIADRLMEKNPNLIVDLSHAPLPVRSRALARSHTIIVVTTPLLPSLRNTRLLIEQVNEMRDGKAPIHLVVNHSGVAAGIEVSKKDIQETIGHAPAAIIPHEPKLFTLSEIEEKPIYRSQKAAHVVNSLSSLVHEIFGKTKNVENKSFLANIFSKK